MKKIEFNWIKKISENCLLRAFFAPSICDFIACQFALESNFGSSKLSVVANNFSGMKVPFKRVSYCELNSHYGEFCVYLDLNRCISDYIARFFYFCPSRSAVTFLDTFVLELRNSGYCPEKDYISRIEKIYNSFINYQNSNQNENN